MRQGHFTLTAPYPDVEHTILLPPPELQNSLNKAHKVELRQAMTGDLYTTVKAQVNTRNLIWTLILTRMKALEYYEFCRVHLADRVRLTWTIVDLVGYLVINPTELAMEKSAIVADSLDECQVKLEFRSNEDLAD